MNFGRSDDPFGFSTVQQDVGIGLQQGFVIDTHAPAVYAADGPDSPARQQQQQQQRQQQEDEEDETHDSASSHDRSPTQQGDDFSFDFAVADQPPVDLLQELRRQTEADSSPGVESEGKVEAEEPVSTAAAESQQLEPTEPAVVEPKPAGFAAVQSEDPKSAAVQSEDPKSAVVQSEDPKSAAVQSEDPKSAAVQSEDPKCAAVQSEDPKCAAYQSKPAEPAFDQSEQPEPVFSQSEPDKPAFDQSDVDKLVFGQSEQPEPAFGQSEQPEPAFSQSEQPEPAFSQSAASGPEFPASPSSGEPKPGMAAADQSDSADDLPSALIGPADQPDNDVDSDSDEPEATDETPPSVVDAVAHFDACGVLATHRAGIEPTVAYSGLAAVRRLLCGPPRLRAGLRDRRDFIFCLANCQFDNSDAMHQRMLSAVYRGLHADPRKICPRFGSHWESVGFQGDDPSTDLRGCGMLGLLCLLHLVSEPRLQQLRDAAFRLSQDERQNFPFCVMSINLTRVALVALRRESLNAMINDSGDAVGTFLLVYSCLLRRLHRLWQAEAKTIMDSGFVVRDLEDACVKDAAGLVREASDSGSSVRASRQQQQQQQQQDSEFVDLCADDLGS